MSSYGRIEVVVDENECPGIVLVLFNRFSKRFIEGEAIDCEPQCDVSFILKVEVLQGIESLFILRRDGDLFLTEMVIVLSVENILELATQRDVWA